MVRVIWSPEALTSLQHIRSYIAQFNAEAAELISRDLEEAGNSLDTFPNRGRPARGGMRELATVPPYVLRYRVVEQSVIIVRIKHGRQRR